MKISSGSQFLNSSLADDHTIQQLGIDLSKCYWALLNRFWTNQGHSASCQKKWGLAATDMCPCGKQQCLWITDDRMLRFLPKHSMTHTVNPFVNEGVT